MATLIVHHKVKDYATWRPFFDEDNKNRVKYGSTGFKVYKSASDPNDLTVVMDWSSIDGARQFATSPALKDIMEQAGVISQPEVSFLEDV